MDTLVGDSDAAQAAVRADLVYVNDTEVGIRRSKSGDGFIYVSASGEPVTSAKALARIRTLAIPPAWTDVWICARDEGHIQATGRDQRARKQYRYHPAWTACRDEAKFSSLAAFAQALPRLRTRVDKDLRKRGLGRERVLASAVHLLDQTLIRVGNDSYSRENNSFGLTTLRSRHLDIESSSLRFAFTGKSGQKWRLKLTDRRMASVIRAIQELPGQRLFQYLDDQGARHDVHSHDVNDYIKAVIGPEFTSKHFRTWGASVSAAIALAHTERPNSKRQQAIALNAVLDDVARLLHNTRAVCRRCYVHPAIINAWQDGELGDQLAALRRRYPKPFKNLDGDESAVRRWLAQSA
jgi:DNA topoisomerase-1